MYAYHMPERLNMCTGMPKNVCFTWTFKTDIICSLCNSLSLIEMAFIPVCEKQKEMSSLQITIPSIDHGPRSSEKTIYRAFIHCAKVILTK